VQRITIGSLAYNAPETATLYDQPEVESSAVRVSGPFTVEAVQPPMLDPDAVDVEGRGAAVADGNDAGAYLDRMIEQLRCGSLTVRGQNVAIKRIAPLSAFGATGFGFA
jgi:hypothetical protein